MASDIEVLPRVSRFNESTLLPVSLIIVIIGFVYWLSSLSFQVSANAKDLENQKLDSKVTQSNMILIQQDLALIKGMLEGMKRGR